MAKNQDQLAMKTLSTWLRFERAQSSADAAHAKFCEAREAMGADKWATWCKDHNLANGSAEAPTVSPDTQPVATAVANAMHDAADEVEHRVEKLRAKNAKAISAETI